MRFFKSLLSILLILTILALAAAGLHLIFSKADDQGKASILVEAAKALLELVLVAIVGAAAAAVFKGFDRRRQGCLALQEFRQDFLEQLSSNYRSIKKVRRALRRDGLTSRFTGSMPSMNEGLRECYKGQMDLLNEVQLVIEMLKIRAVNIPNAFSGSENLAKALGDMENYARKVLKEYEEYWPKLDADPPTAAPKDLAMLIDFTGKYEKSMFKKEFTANYDLALSSINKDLLPIHVAHSV